MPFAITQQCCTDASCVSVCPVSCIHPTPGEPDFGTTDMLYVDPAACIDCGACADACPVDAAVPVGALTGSAKVFAELNERWYADHPRDHRWGPPRFPCSLPDGVELARVAVVGTGPAAGYLTQSLLRSTDAEITVVDRLTEPGGLLRGGVAPDHPATRRIAAEFAQAWAHPRVDLRLGFEVGRDVTHDELLAQHSAVVYAVGAPGDRRLDVPGEDLPGSLAATEVVGWWNAHPDHAGVPVDLTGPRVVVVGTGNVALDVARILLADPRDLAGTDIAAPALQALRGSAVREVVLLGRGGPGRAAFTRSEWLGLRQVAGLDIVVDDSPEVAADLDAAEPGSVGALLADLRRERVDWSAPSPADRRRLVLRFCSPVAALEGRERVEAVRLASGETIPTGLVLRAIGSRGRALPGLPFDPHRGLVPNDAGRVVDPATGAPVPGVYVTGWAKRGPSGGIGANRRCAEETLDALLDDAAAGLLPTPPRRRWWRLLRG